MAKTKPKKPKLFDNYKPLNPDVPNGDVVAMRDTRTGEIRYMSGKDYNAAFPGWTRVSYKKQARPGGSQSSK